MTSPRAANFEDDAATEAPDAEEDGVEAVDGVTYQRLNGTLIGFVTSDTTAGGCACFEEDGAVRFEAAVEVDGFFGCTPPTLEAPPTVPPPPAAADPFLTGGAPPSSASRVGWVRFDDAAPETAAAGAGAACRDSGVIAVADVADMDGEDVFL